jgi:hypothetical protein
MKQLGVYGHMRVLSTAGGHMPTSPTPVNTQRTTLMLPKAVWRQLRYLALQQNRTVGAVVTEALVIYLKKVGKL